MSNADQEVIDCPAEPADPIDVFYVEWAQETLKRILPFVNEVSRLLITLATSLLGGGAVLLRKELVAPWVQVGALCLFLAGLAIALWNVLPYEGLGINLYDPVGIAEHKQWALRRKLLRLKLASLALVIGLGVVLLGLILRATGLNPPATTRPRATPSRQVRQLALMPISASRADVSEKCPYRQHQRAAGFLTFVGPY